MKQHENFKFQISNIKNIVKNSKFLKYLLIFFAFILLIVNFISSQTISPIYFRFVNNDKKAVINFLQKIKTFPEFQKILEMNKNIYGETIKNEVFKEENKKRVMINNLEQILTKNPKARDVLYSLYLLYKEKGDNLTVEKYLKQTREVDPAIGL